MFIALIVLLSGLSSGLAEQIPDAIPDAATLLKDVQVHQHEMDAIRENYTFHRIRRTEDIDRTGAVKATNTQEREVFFVNGRQLARLVKKNGADLSAPEEKAEQVRIGKLIETALKSPPKPGMQIGPVRLIGDILAVATISNPRRLSLNSRSTLAFDFAGDPNARVQDSRDTMQNAAKKMAGTIWFDEADRQVARLEVVLDDNFSIAGGLLASIRKGTTLKLEQSPVGAGLWMQTANEQYFDARVLVKGFRQNVRVEDFDFKRFDVETLQHVRAPG